MPNRRIFGGWYQFFDDDQRTQGTPPPGGMASSLLGSSSVTATLTKSSVTPPVAGGFGFGASWGGGGYKPHEGGMRRKKRVPVPSMSGFVQKVAEDLTSTITENLKKNTYANPMETLTKGVTGDKVKEGMIRALRKRITALEENIRKLKGQNATNVSELQAALADQAVETEELERVIEQLETDLRVEQVRAAAYQAARTKGAQLLAAYPGDPAPSSRKLVIGALAYLAVELLIPGRMQTLKDIGRVAAAGVAISGLVDLLR